jgi:hypothetical protein
MSGTTGTYAFAPALSEIAIDALERCGLPATSLNNERTTSVRRSMNFVLSSWSNRGINLWTVQEVVQPMPQGVTQYFDDASCVDILPASVTMRQYMMGAPTSVTPAFATNLGSANVAIGGFPVTPTVGSYINVGVQVSVGGLIISGTYQVQSVPSSGYAVINAGKPATISISTPGGSVPVFAMTQASNVVTVTFANHGKLAGQTFTVERPTAIGGGQLFGPYTVQPTSLTGSTFQILASFKAGFNTNLAENGGKTLLSSQVAGIGFASNPTDLLLWAISRDEYMAIPNKSQQARPTSFWIDRQVVPVINVWPAPDNTGPFELRYRRSRQIQDADIINGLQLQAPFRFLEAYTAELAAMLATKFAPDRAVPLTAYAGMKWQEVAGEDRERVSTYIVPDFAAYYG